MLWEPFLLCLVLQETTLCSLHAPKDRKFLFPPGFQVQRAAQAGGVCEPPSGRWGQDDRAEAPSHQTYPGREGGGLFPSPVEE